MASRLLAAALMCCALLGSEDPMAEPRYSGDRLVRPEKYREWMFIGSNLGMGYSEGQPKGDPTFHNIYMQRQAYRAFADTGRFPDKTMLVMELVSARTNASINRQGQFQDRAIGIEVALKDERRYPEKWAYFSFVGSGGKPLPEARPFAKAACWQCHNEHGAADNVFAQFYPVLRDHLKP
jgi:hypothetical protein